MTVNPKLIKFAIGFALVVIILGAYTRLTDAGLGCPDWPGCYGHLFVPQEEAAINQANAAYPERPVEQFKAWNEMVHRYFAGTLGLIILFIAATAWLKRHQEGPVKLPLFLLGLVSFQAVLGMWTVTMNLLPMVVMMHLLGGFATLSCLFLLYLRTNDYQLGVSESKLANLSKWAGLGLVILVAQIALGGWVSTNYAALACTEFPICEGDWSAKFDVGGAFSIPEADDYEFGVHGYAERMTMHVIHRFGAIVAFLYLGWFAFFVYNNAASNLMRKSSVILGVVLTVQVLLGISNIVYSLPLAVATMHNAVAACLLLVMVFFTYTLSKRL